MHEGLNSGAPSKQLECALVSAFDNNASPQLLLAPGENRILHFNASAEAFFRDIGVALLGCSIVELYRESMGALHVASQEAIERGHAVSRDIFLNDQKQDALDLEHWLSACWIGSDLYIVVTIIDLTVFRRRSLRQDTNNLYRQGLEEWRRAEQFLREIELRNQLILRAAGEGIFGVDNLGQTTFVNPAAEEMLGWSADEVIGRNMHETVHYKHADGSRYPTEQCPIYNAFEERIVNTVDDEVFWRKDGKPLRVEYTSTPIIDDDDISVGAVIVFRDISERKENEQKLQRALDENARLRDRLENENEYLQEEILTHSNHSEILGQSGAIRNVVQQIELVAGTNANILITGESGTGKELVASAIHRASGRQDRPLIRVNCAAVASELFESEFFGHMKGAFTGAHRDRIGRFELANGGTLFLDEVGEIPLHLQSKLLRVLQEKKFERVGEEKTRDVDVRLIAATNRDLKKEVVAGRFREDLYFRVNVFPIHCAPLRERRSDIPLLAKHFLKLSCNGLNVPEPKITRADIDSLTNYDWPGNARELQNVIERAVILARNGRLRLNLPRASLSRPQIASSENSLQSGISAGATEVLTANQIEEIEVRNIQNALRVTDGRVSGKEGAAELLGMKPTTLYSRIKKLKLDEVS